ncbi:unnamed protein product, partial [marine sediment metagenome]
YRNKAGVDDFLDQINRALEGIDRDVADYSTAGEFGYNTWDGLSRAVILFDTSDLPDDADISGVCLDIFVADKQDGLNISPSVGIYSSNSRPYFGLEDWK